MMPDAFDRLVADMKRLEGRARVGALDERGIPPCCTFGACIADFTLMHAALAAHLLYVYGNVSPTGGSASAFQSMRLGPASRTKGKSEWSGNPADAFLDTTAPGQLYLYLRSKYVMSIFCS